MATAQPSLSFIVVRVVSTDIPLTLKQVHNAILMLLQLFDVHVVKVAATDSTNV